MVFAVLNLVKTACSIQNNTVNNVAQLFCYGKEWEQLLCKFHVTFDKLINVPFRAIYRRFNLIV